MREYFREQWQTLLVWWGAATDQTKLIWKDAEMQQLIMWCLSFLVTLFITFLPFPFFWPLTSLAASLTCHHFTFFSASISSSVIVENSHALPFWLAGLHLHGARVKPNSCSFSNHRACKRRIEFICRQQFNAFSRLFFQPSVLWPALSSRVCISLSVRYSPSTRFLLSLLCVWSGAVMLVTTATMSLLLRRLRIMCAVTSCTLPSSRSRGTVLASHFVGRCMSLC